jgi:hypothetical protein
MRRVISPRKGRPLRVVTCHPQGQGYDLTVRYRPTMSHEDGSKALEALLATVRDIEALLADEK